MTKRLMLVLALAACHKNRDAAPHEVLEVVSLKTVDAVTLDASVKVMPPEPGTLIVEFIDDTSPLKQHCTAKIALATFAADGGATGKSALSPKCTRPIQPAGFYARVTYDRGGGKPVLTAPRVFIPGFLGGTNTLIDAKQLEQDILARVKLAAPPEQPNPNAELDQIVAAIMKSVDSVPGGVPDASIACPKDKHVYLLPFDLALAVRNHQPLQGWALDVELAEKDPVYELVRYRHGDAYQPAPALVGKTPAFLRVTDLAIPSGKETRGRYAGGLYVIGDDGKVVCQAPVAIETTANDRASWATQTRAKLAAQLANL